MKKAGWTLLCSLAFVAGAHAAPTIALVGDGDGYDETDMNAFRSTSVAKGFDLNGDDVYGSHGLFFFGDGLPDDQGGEPFTCHTQVGAEWATFAQGTNFASIAEGYSYSYASIDDPEAIPVADVAGWDIRSAGGVANTPADIGSWCEIVTFDIDATTPSEFRMGIMAGNMNNENWNPSGLRVSVDGGTPVAVNNLPGTVGQANFVFFDVDLNGATNGTFSVEAQRRADTQGASFAGITFDTTTAVDWSGGALELGADSLSLDLVAPATNTNGVINALYIVGPAETDVEILSAVASNGFSASYVSSTLSTVNTNEEIMITYDNTSIGLENGESTNSALVVTWSEVGSSVINTSEATLAVSYINVPNSPDLDEDSLSLVLDEADTSTTDVIVVSYVEGTIADDVEILSIESSNSDFSVAPASFTLNTGNPTQDVTITYNNTGALVSHGDTAESTAVVTWVDAASGLTNTAEVALSVSYHKTSQVTELWTVGIDFGATVSTDPNYSWNHISVGGDYETLGLAGDGSVVIADVVDVDGATIAGVDFMLTNNSGEIAWDFTGSLNGDGAYISDASVYEDALISNDASKFDRDLVVGEDYLTFIFSGLDDGLIYTLSSGFNSANVNFMGLWSADGKSATTDYGAAADGVGYISLEGLTTDGNGNLEIRLDGQGDSCQLTVAAMTLTAYSITPTEIGDASVVVLADGTEVTISWQGQSGASYTLEAANALVGSSWIEIETGVEGPSGILSVTNAITADQQFFRVRLED
jgi:hypothetical protein